MSLSFTLTFFISDYSSFSVAKVFELPKVMRSLTLISIISSIVRTNSLYQCKRSHNLRKFKDFQDAEAYIVGYEEGKGKREGHLGKFIMQDEDGNKFGCPPGKGYNYKDMKEMLENIHEYMGQEATFTYFERTKAGSYRHPLYKGLRNYE